MARLQKTDRSPWLEKKKEERKIEGIDEREGKLTGTARYRKAEPARRTRRRRRRLGEDPRFRFSLPRFLGTLEVNCAGLKTEEKKKKRRKDSSRKKKRTNFWEAIRSDHRRTEFCPQWEHLQKKQKKPSLRDAACEKKKKKLRILPLLLHFRCTYAGTEKQNRREKTAPSRPNEREKEERGNTVKSWSAC